MYAKYYIIEREREEEIKKKFFFFNYLINYLNHKIYLISKN